MTCGSSKTDNPTPCPPWWGNSPSGQAALIWPRIPSKTSAPAAPCATGRPPRSGWRRAGRGCRQPRRCRRLHGCGRYRPSSRPLPRRYRRLPAGRCYPRPPGDRNGAAHVSRVRRCKQIRAKFDRRSVVDLGRSFAGAQHLDLGRTRARALRDLGVRQPAQLVSVKISASSSASLTRLILCSASSAATIVAVQAPQRRQRGRLRRPAAGPPTRHRPYGLQRQAAGSG